MSFILILIGLMLLGDGLWWWHSHRKLRGSPRKTLWRWGIGVFMGFQGGFLLVMLIGRLVGMRIDQHLGQIALSLVFIWHFILLPAALLILLAQSGADVGGWIIRCLKKPRSEPAPVNYSRRAFVTGALAAPPLLTAAATGVAINQLDDFRIRPFELRVPRLPGKLDGLTIAHVSDTHVGGFTHGRVLEKIIDETAKLDADLVLFSGDLINHALSSLPDACDMVERLRCRHGLFICEGNHDLIEDRFAFERYVRSRGLPLLINESTTIAIKESPIQILGLRWGGVRSSRSRDPREQQIQQSMDLLLSQRNPDAFQILLAHHPHAFDAAAKNQIPLTLSGHTHGGQLMAGNLGFGPLMFRYYSGLYEKDESKLLVSNGVGNWFPLRIGAPAEILHVTLRACM